MINYDIPKTVKELLEWKISNKKTCTDKNWPLSVEEFIKNKEYTRKCNEKNQTDVLYSFLGIYAIGIWTYNQPNESDIFKTDADKTDRPDIFKMDANKLRVLNEKGKYQCLCSKQFLFELQDKRVNEIKVKELNQFIERTFVPVYFEVGNLIPMWPGGNIEKGNQNNGYMDIPELFFHRYTKWYEELTTYEESFLDGVGAKVKEDRFKSFNDFLKSVETVEKYQEYVNYAVDNIISRTKRIKAFLI